MTKTDEIATQVMRTVSRVGVLVVVASLLLVAYDRLDATPAEPRGIFVLSEGRPLPQSVIASDVVTGLSLRAGWKGIQPQPARFAWVFDGEIQRAASAGKRVTLRVVPDRPPEWLYDAGAARFAFTDSNRYRETHGEKRAIPVPWDPVFLQHWTRFIKAIGQRYGANEHVVLVHLAGPGMMSEMVLPRTAEDQEHWKRIGYSRQKLVDAWRTTIDAYAEAFPAKHLALNVALPVYDDGVVEDVLAYAQKRIGERFCVQHNGLSAKTKPTWSQHRWVISLRDQARIGFQLATPVTPQGRFNADGRRFGGTMAEALTIGLAGGAAYLEIYAADLSDEASVRALRDAGRRLAAASPASR